MARFIGKTFRSTYCNSIFLHKRRHSFRRYFYRFRRSRQHHAVRTGHSFFQITRNYYMDRNAEEVGLGLPAATVAASEVPEAVQIVQDVFMRPVFRVYRSDDIRGVEYGGALKNIVALACGVQDGIGLGDNCRAALMTRGLVEMARFGVHFGARRETFFGLSGMGDLVATCTSTHSRNHRAGLMLGKGKTAKEICEGTHMVVEGMRTAFLVNEIARREHIDMPITEEVCRLLEGEHTAQEALENLMTRAKKAEIETYLEP